MDRRRRLYCSEMRAEAQRQARSRCRTSSRSSAATGAGLFARCARPRRASLGYTDPTVVQARTPTGPTAGYRQHRRWACRSRPIRGGQIDDADMDGDRSEWPSAAWPARTAPVPRSCDGTSGAGAPYFLGGLGMLPRSGRSTGRSRCRTAGSRDESVASARLIGRDHAAVQQDIELSGMASVARPGLRPRRPRRLPRRAPGRLSFAFCFSARRRAARVRSRRYGPWGGIAPERRGGNQAVQ